MTLELWPLRTHAIITARYDIDTFEKMKILILIKKIKVVTININVKV